MSTGSRGEQGATVARRNHLQQTPAVESARLTRKLGLGGFAAPAGIPAAGLYVLWPAGAAPAGAADKVVVLKSQRRLLLIHSKQILKTCRVSLGRKLLGAKSLEGDHRTPERNYLLDYPNPYSQFHLALHVSYPNGADLDSARPLGIAPGREIMIHGLPNGLGCIRRLHRFADWTGTDGCIAVTDSEIEQF